MTNIIKIIPSVHPPQNLALFLQLIAMMLHFRSYYCTSQTNTFRVTQQIKIDNPLQGYMYHNPTLSVHSIYEHQDPLFDENIYVDGQTLAHHSIPISTQR
jgi:hypothetical protein